MENLILRKPNKNDKSAVEELKDELIKNDSDFAGESGLVKNNLKYEDWLKKIELHSNPESVPQGKVLSDQFLTIRENDNKIIGMVNVRYALNEKLNLSGGHIGDFVRPSERNKGYGTAQIFLAIKILKNKGVSNVLITCKKENIASARTIEKNGGVFENEVEVEGEIFKRYWIKV